MFNVKFASSPSRDVAQLFCDKNSSLGFINLVSTKPTLYPRSITRAPPSVVPSPTSPRTGAMKTSSNPAALSDARKGKSREQPFLAGDATSEFSPR